MKRTQRRFDCWLLALALVQCTTCVGADDPTVKLSADAYIYGYPLVLMDTTRQVMTAVSKPERTRAPINQFNVSQEFPDATFTDVVSPNADTLYSFSWLDLSKELMVLDLPDTGDRYYVMQMLDAWTNVFAAPGPRTTGNRKGSYAIIGPGWRGTIPDGVKVIQSPTDMVWILGRTQTNGKADYAAVRAIKKQYVLTPLSDWGKSYTPPADVPVDPNVNTKMAPVEQVEKLNPIAFFERLSTLLEHNPPAEADAPMVATLAQLGIVRGKPWDVSKLDLSTRKAIEDGVQTARSSLNTEAKSLSNIPPVNGWAIVRDAGRFGTKYRHRAVIAIDGLGANLPEDAIYPMTGVAGDGKPLTGANKYVLRFPKAQLPPAKAFWSLTMYNAKHFFVENPIDRYAIGDRDKLKLDPDGSLTLYLQHESPGKEHESNWLPAPKEYFNLILRIYRPDTSVMEGSWVPPAVVQAK